MTPTESYAEERKALVRSLRAQGIRDERVLQAMGEVPREEFVPEELRDKAYLDKPLPIALEQTISQPYVVAWMLEHLQLSPGDKVLEVGTGSGYAAAILSLLASKVISVERHAELAVEARERLGRLGYAVEVVAADGTLVFEEAAPYDAILVSAGGPKLPPALQRQLAVGGRLVMPVGQFEEQQLWRVRRTANCFRRLVLGSVRFVPLLGAQGWKE